MKTNNLDDVHNSLERIRTVQFELRCLADAFYQTGNSKVSNELTDLCRILSESRDCIHNSIGDMVHQRTLDAQASSINVLRAALAGAGSNILSGESEDLPSGD